jgi:hypothetical protein
MLVELDKVREIVRRMNMYVPKEKDAVYWCQECGWNGKQFLQELDKLEAEQCELIKNKVASGVKKLVKDIASDLEEPILQSYFCRGDECKHFKGKFNHKIIDLIACDRIPAGYMFSKETTCGHYEPKEKALSLFLHTYKAGKTIATGLRTQDDIYEIKQFIYPGKEPIDICGMEHIKTEPWEG